MGKVQRFSRYIDPKGISTLVLVEKITYQIYVGALRCGMIKKNYPGVKEPEPTFCSFLFQAVFSPGVS